MECGHAGARCHHLAQRLEARGAEVLRVAHADPAAYLERLVAQAMAFLEQQQRRVLEIRHAHPLVRGERMTLGHGEQELLAVELARLEPLELHGKREDADVELPGVQPLEHRRSLVLVQVQLQARQGLADQRRHPRQKVRADGRQQRDAQPAAERILVTARELHHLIARLEDAARACHDLLAHRRE